MSIGRQRSFNFLVPILITRPPLMTNTLHLLTKFSEIGQSAAELLQFNLTIISIGAIPPFALIRKWIVNFDHSASSEKHSNTKLVQISQSVAEIRPVNEI